MGMKDRTPTSVEEYLEYRIRFSNWDRWGADDQFGTLNHIDHHITKHALNLVETGRTVSCANPIATETMVPDLGRNDKPADHHMSVSNIGASDYIGIAYHGFVNTHIDSLCHFFTNSVDEDGRLYNNRDPALITDQGALTNSVENWKNGIVTRGVLYDIPKLRNVDYVEFRDPVQGWELEDWANSVNVKQRDGDVVLIRSGHDQYWDARGNADPGHSLKTPGNAPSIIEYLYNTNAAILGWDLQEAAHKPVQYPAGYPIHQLVIPYMGMPILDNVNMEDLASACAELGRYEFLIFIAPLFIQGGTGSPVNPIVVF